VLDRAAAVLGRRRDPIVLPAASQHLEGDQTGHDGHDGGQHEDVQQQGAGRARHRVIVTDGW
jgi:hypothetical protein